MSNKPKQSPIHVLWKFHNWHGYGVSILQLSTSWFMQIAVEYNQCQTLKTCQVE